MSILNPTPPERMVDPQGRPYFLWDMDMTLERFREVLRDSDPQVRAYFAGKLMRQAKPDDVFLFLSAAEIRGMWDLVSPYLGVSRPFWQWLIERWESQSHVRK